MTIRRIDPGQGDGFTGEDEWTRSKNTDANFQDMDNAAAYMVGSNLNQIPRTQDVAKAFLTVVAAATTNCNTLPVGSKVYAPAAITNAPKNDSDGAWLIYTEASNIAQTALVQTAIGYKSGQTQVRSSINSGGTWTVWVPISSNKVTYNTTTALGANVVIGADGVLMRSTSSERFKDNITEFVLSDEMYDKVMNLSPIKYNSNTDNDDNTIDYYSFSAEKIGAIDPAFTLWREENGKVIAEGLNINAILALQHAISIKQDNKIKELENKINKLLE